MKWIIVSFMFLTGCASIHGTAVPTGYGQYVKILKGTYEGNTGKLIGDCSGFENYMIELGSGRRTCVKIWNMEAL